MKIIESSVYVGPNLYCLEPMVRMRVDFGRHADDAERVRSDLPDFMHDVCHWKRDGAWLDAHLTDKPLNMGTLLAAMSLALQDHSGCEINLNSLVIEIDRDVYDVLYSYDNMDVGLDAGELGLKIFEKLIDGRASDITEEDLFDDYDDFLYFAERRALGPSTMSMIRAAEARDIPWFRMNDESLVQFGHGKYARRIEATVTSNTSLIASEIASDKSLTNQILEDLGLPVPRQAVVNSVSRALRAAGSIGYPVVTKPLDGNHGKGVTIDINDDEALEEGFERAAEYSSRGDVIIESFIEGFDHRLLVIDGKLEAAARRMPAHVVGDGRTSIETLVDRVNEDPRRGVGHENVLTRIELNKKALMLLAERGLDAKSVPDAGEVVLLADTANLSTGGTAVDVTDVIHPDNREMAERAIKAIGLDIGGVDFLTSDITRSYKEHGGGICEINAGPGFRMHVAPSEGKPRDIAGKVMDMLFPDNQSARIPTIALTGTNGKTTTARMVSHLMQMAGHHVGLTTTDAVYSNGNLVVKGDMTGPAAARMVLRDPDVDAAVLETARGGLVRRGLGYDAVDVGACLNVTSDHLGLGGIDTLEQLAQVKSTVVRVARNVAVLNADDTFCRGMADGLQAKEILWVTMESPSEAVQVHVAAGGKAVALEPGDHDSEEIVIYDQCRRMPLIKTRLIPATLEGKAVHNVQNAMFAVAMVYSVGKSLDTIRQGLRTFDSNFFQTPGRMNIFDEHPFRTILDYGHNEAAVRAMVQTVEKMAPRGKKHVVVTCPGDRRDEDVVAIANQLAGHFDSYICYTEDNPRDREAGQVGAMLGRALQDAGVVAEEITVVPLEPEAVQMGLQRSQPDDLLLVFGEAISRTWKQIIYFCKTDGNQE